MIIWFNARFVLKDDIDLLNLRMTMKIFKRFNLWRDNNNFGKETLMRVFSSYFLDLYEESLFCIYFIS